jgi:hypothetical protein
MSAPILFSCCTRSLLLLLLLVVLLLVSDNHTATAFPLHTRTTINVCANTGGRWKSHSRRRIKWRSFPSTTTELETRNSLPPISDRNIEFNTTDALVYDPEKDRFVRASSSQGLAALYSVDQRSESLSTRIKRAVRHSFLPQGVNKSYYHFMKWRIFQRFINSNLHVLGTQSLIMGLGIKSAKTLGISAALTWVLKDALGKVTRLVWASKMGRRFDSDSKRWRFRASIVYALGNYLEIVTYVNPRLFLLWATLANSCKQVAMLTSSATRTSLYNSFRDGKRENIADITAKGEAQIAIVDLCGIAFGVTLSSLVGTSIKSVLTTYFILQISEIFCLFRQIQGVQFPVMNFERMTKVIEAFCDGIDERDSVSSVNGTSSINGTTTKSLKINTAAKINGDMLVPTPGEMARNERIFLPPQHLRRRTLAFGSLGRTKLDPKELSKLIELFSNERYMLVVGANSKNPHRRRGFFQKSSFEEKIQQGCHIVLHEEATNLDVLKSTLALFILRRKLLALAIDEQGDDSSCKLRSSDCWGMLEEVRYKTDQLFPLLLKQLSKQGWSSPSRSMFGRVSRRAYWPLGYKNKSSSSSSRVSR